MSVYPLLWETQSDLEDLLLEGMEDDFLSVEGLTSGQYLQIGEDGEPTATAAVDKMLWRATDEGLAVATRGLQVNDQWIASKNIRVCHMLRRAIDPIVPKTGDVIVDHRGTRWTIHRIQWQTLEIRYRFTCTDETP